MKTITITERPKIKTSQLLEEARSLFPVWSYYDDARLDKEFPAPKKATTRHFLNSVEPDEVTLGKSTREADPDMKGITLRERIMLEIAFFKETGKHLDIKGVTFCSGSRYADGSVPYAYWYDDLFGIGWYNLDYSNSDYGIRSAVSLNSSSSLPIETQETPDITQALQTVKDAGYIVYKQM